MALEPAQLRRTDFWSTRRHARPGALSYVDPPYTAQGSERVFDRYSWPPFREAKLLKLGRFLDIIAETGIEIR
jgi:site-specific DNA-adenine methylase